MGDGRRATSDGRADGVVGRRRLRAGFCWGEGWVEGVPCGGTTGHPCGGEEAACEVTGLSEWRPGRPDELVAAARQRTTAADDGRGGVVGLCCVRRDRRRAESCGPVERGRPSRPGSVARWELEC